MWFCYVGTIMNVKLIYERAFPLGLSITLFILCLAGFWAWDSLYRENEQKEGRQL